MKDPHTILFREDQHFRSPWLMLILGVGALLALVSGLALVVLQVLLHHPLGNKQLPDSLALAIGLFEIAVAAGLLCLFWASVLQVEVTRYGLFLRFAPFHRKTRQIDLTSVVGIHAVRYRPLRDYGGWGLRGGVRSRCYNVSGDEGVRIDYENGCHVLIGSQQATELDMALHQIWQAPIAPAKPKETPNA